MESSSAQQLQYGDIVFVDLADNAVNFADDVIQGHRVQSRVARDDLNTFFKWSRPASQDRPVGLVKYLSELEDCLFVSFSDGFLDLDAVSNGLSYTTGTLVNQSQANQISSMNDIVLSFILYKVYGKSSYDIRNVVFNLADAFEMVESMTVAKAISTSISFNNERGQSVDTMFVELLQKDPNRFFDEEGNQIPGLFETNTDTYSCGSWLFTEDDCIEIKLQFTFQENVTRRHVTANQQPLKQQGGMLGEQATEETIIPKDATFVIRLQLKVTTERSPARIYQLLHTKPELFTPAAPTNVVLTQTTRARELAVAYETEYSSGLPILETRIRVYDESDHLVKEVFNTNLIQGLDTKNFKVTVTASNGIGYGKESEISNLNIPILTVADPPTNILLSQTEVVNQLQVTWSRPEYDGGEESLTYTIVVFDSTGNQVQTLSSDESPLLIDTLQPTETYTVRISTLNSVGESLVSDPSNGMSPLGV